jgi:hypothetical protein
VFCALEGSGRVLLENELALCIADAYPVTPGYSLVIPRRHGPMGWRCISRNGTRWWMRAVDPETRSGGLERFD